MALLSLHPQRYRKLTKLSTCATGNKPVKIFVGPVSYLVSIDVL